MATVRSRRGREPRDGDQIEKEHVKLVGWPASSRIQVATHILMLSGPRPNRAYFGQRAVDRLQARQPRGWCGVAAGDSRGHARDR